MQRAGLYVDGFNLYHGIDDLVTRSISRPHHYKWLSLKALGELVLALDQKRTKAQSQLAQVRYFSAWARHLHRPGAPGEPTTFGKQQVYERALRATGVVTYMADFKPKHIRCKGPHPHRAVCGHTWTRHEEKQSDVAIAVHLLEDVFCDLIDHCYVLSGDTDLLPALRILRTRFPQKRVVCVTPPGRPTPTEIQRLVDATITLREANLGSCLLPGELKSDDGSLIRRPRAYDPA